MRVINVSLPISNSGDLSQATLSSDPIFLDNEYGFAVQVAWSGGPATGTVKIQGSCDPGGTAPGGSSATVTNWSDIAGATLAVAGASGNGIVNLDATYYKYARVFYTKTAGAGTLTARVQSKGA